MARSTTTHFVTRGRAVLLAITLVVSVFAGSAVVAAPVGAQDDASAGFHGDSYREIAAGDPIRTPYTIRMSNTEYATIVITSARNTEHTGSDAWWANVTLHDTDGDGQVNLTINTWEMGHSNPFEAESGEVAAFDQDELPPDEMIGKSDNQSQDAHDLLLAAGQDPAAVVQSYSDNGRLRIQEAETPGIEPATAPKGFSADSMADIYRQPDPFSNLAAGLSVEGDRIVAAGDTMVLMPWGGGLYGATEHAMDVEGVDSPEAAFQWLLENDHYRYNVTQLNVPDGAEPKVLDVDRAIEEGAFRFYDGLHYYHIATVIDTGAPVFEQGGEYVSAEPGDRFKTQFQRGLPRDPDYGPRLLVMNWSVVEPRVDIQSPVRSLQDDEIGGSSTLAPGTNFTVAVNVEGETTEYDAFIMKTPGAAEDHITSGIEVHPWNFSVDLGDDVDATEVQVAAYNDEWGLMGAFPPDYVPEGMTTTPSPDTSTTTADPGDESTTTPPDTTTASGDGGSGSDGDGGDGGDGGSDGDGGGGTIPGFTAGVALLAVIAAGLLAIRRE